MEIDDAIDAIMAFLKIDKFDDRAEIISEMEIARRLNAGKYQFFEMGHLHALSVNEAPRLWQSGYRSARGGLRLRRTQQTRQTENMEHQGVNTHAAQTQKTKQR